MLGIAGGTSAHVDPDSLLRVWRNDALSPEPRSRAMYTLIIEAYKTRPDSAMVLVDELMALGERTRSKEAMAFAHFAKARTYDRTRDFMKARAEYERSRSIWEALPQDSMVLEVDFEHALSFYDEQQYDRSLELLRACMKDADHLGNRRRSVDIANYIGVIHKRQGDYMGALHQFESVLERSAELNDMVGMSNAYNNLGVVHAAVGDYPKALEYYELALAKYQETNNGASSPKFLNNIAWIHYHLAEYPDALHYAGQCRALASELGHTVDLAGSLALIGRIRYTQGDALASLREYRLARRIQDSIGFEYGLATTWRYIGEALLKLDSVAAAIEACTQGHAYSRKVGSIEREGYNCRCLYRAYKKLGRTDSALKYQELSTVLEDSMALDQVNLETQRMSYELRLLGDSLARQEEKLVLQRELATKERTRDLFMYAGGVLLLIAVGLISRVNYMRRTNGIIRTEKERSDDLLLNILPASVANELKEKGETQAELFEQVTVLFTDFKGFTAMSEKLGPKELVKDLHECFSAFDRICEAHGLEKIKTIGDAYMAAGGLPVPNTTHALDVIQTALEMRDFIAEGKARKIAADLPYFEIRIGIHTGPVVAGIVGVKKFQYDIWGDTVNTASRMESSGEVGQVNISETTYMLVKDEHGLTFTPRGKVQAKGKGEMEMYFVSDRT
ncbi:MAG: tetratricopeptide repeat protein [Flavobacteriales bacterium]|nr:tetratricopeptide repeat protein [Flavobacteriales bacterium]